MANDLTKILKINSSIWRKLGQLCMQWIHADAKKGKMQTPDGTNNKPYYNEQYARYKANDMRRFTTGEGRIFTDKEGYFFGKTFFRNIQAKTAIQRSGNKTYGTGKRLKGYEGVSITNRDTSKVNMELTGQMFRGLHVENADDVSVTLGYRPEDTKKVVGNKEKYNRDVANLSNENKEKAKEFLIGCFMDNLKKELKDININVKFG